MPTGQLLLSPSDRKSGELAAKVFGYYGVLPPKSVCETSRTIRQARPPAKGGVVRYQQRQSISCFLVASEHVALAPARQYQGRIETFVYLISQIANVNIDHVRGVLVAVVVQVLPDHPRKKRRRNVAKSA
jgi:hypothetical protein